MAVTELGCLRITTHCGTIDGVKYSIVDAGAYTFACISRYVNTRSMYFPYACFWAGWIR
jgi:hypothetical protein